MDKEIINGIDVSECKYLNKVVNEEPYCNIYGEHLYTCSCEENCHYKQLKRKEQECNELIDNNFELVQKYTIKELECEKLKELLYETD